MAKITFKWPSGPNRVLVSGSFDNWNSDYELEKGPDGFIREIEIPTGEIRFKFIVDGIWTVSKNYERRDNGLGSEDNWLMVPEGSDEASSATQSVQKAVKGNKEAVNEKKTQHAGSDGTDGKPVGQPESTATLAGVGIASEKIDGEEGANFESSVTEKGDKRYKVKRIIRKNKKTGERIVLRQVMVEIDADGKEIPGTDHVEKSKTDGKKTTEKSPKKISNGSNSQQKQDKTKLRNDEKNQQKDSHATKTNGKDAHIEKKPQQNGKPQGQKRQLQKQTNKDSNTKQNSQKQTKNQQRPKMASSKSQSDDGSNKSSGFLSALKKYMVSAE